MSLQYLPAVKPSAIALGTVFSQTAELIVLQPVLGDAYRRAKESQSAEEFVRSKQASSAAIAWGTTFVGSALQSYGVGALINATATLSYKGAAYLGTLVFLATSAPEYVAAVFTERRPWDTVLAGVAAKLVNTVGLATFLTWWGTRADLFD